MSILAPVIRQLTHSKRGRAAIAAVAALIVVAVIAPELWGTHAATPDYTATMQGPSLAHPLGTDELGRDNLLRTLVATRLSLVMALSASVIGLSAGAVLGALVTLLRGGARRVGLGAIGLLVMFPSVLLTLFIIAIVGSGTTAVVIAVGAALIPEFARLTVTLSSSVVERDFMLAARTLGVSPRALLSRHLLPNIAETLIVQTTVAFSVSLMTIAALSFLGLGVQAPEYDWGLLLVRGLQTISVTPFAAVGPSIALVMASLVFTYLGEEMGKSFNPRLWTRSVLHENRRARAAAPVTTTPSVHARAVEAAGSDTDLVRVSGLHVGFPSGSGTVHPVRDVSFAMAPGEAVGIVGESGSGKSLTALAISGLLDDPALVSADELRVAGIDLRDGVRRSDRRALAEKVSVVFQDPAASLNPALRIGAQMTEEIRHHRTVGASDARSRAVALLERVGIPSPRARLSDYPHQLSGGMRQRVMIAAGLMMTPRLLIADEPTTALDVTVQAQVLQILRDLRADQELALLFISHDLAVVADVCERVLVMYAGTIVEDIPVADIVDGAAHPYTRALLRALPDMSVDRETPLQGIPGAPPRPDETVSGCRYAARCPIVQDICRTTAPPLVPVAGRHDVACFFPFDPINAPEAHDDARA